MENNNLIFKFLNLSIIFKLKVFHFILFVPLFFIEFVSLNFYPYNVVELGVVPNLSLRDFTLLRAWFNSHFSHFSCLSNF